MPPAPCWRFPAPRADGGPTLDPPPELPPLTPLLERLRRVRPPPGAAATMLAVPSAGDELAGEVAFLFDDLDQIEERLEGLLAAARSDAAEAEQAARRERIRLLAEAHEEGERRAAKFLFERRALAEQRSRAMLDDAEREAGRVRARGRERTPALVAEIVARLLEDEP
jgi:vacuolar-type H+-ATPase subunit H